MSLPHTVDATDEALGEEPPPQDSVDQCRRRSPRLVQQAEGYVATVAAGQVTYENGEATGALPGRLIRGAQPEPTPA